MISCLVNQPTFNAEQVSSEVNKMLHDFHSDVSEDGLTAEFIYLDSSQQFYWTPPGYNSPLFYDSIRQILESNAKMYTKVFFEFENLQLYPLSADYCNYSGIVKGFMIDTSGLNNPVGIIESGTLIKRESGWKFLSGQSSLLNE